jgi:hypothetical protein
MATIDYMIAAYGPYAASATGGNGFARDFLAGIAAMYSVPSKTFNVSTRFENAKNASVRTHGNNEPPGVAIYPPRIPGHFVHHPNLRLLLVWSGDS